jgi:hypothetical protein
MKLDALGKRLAVLEARHISSSVSDCDPNRRLARYASYFDGRPWECTGTPEKRAKREADLIRYQDYFDTLYADDVQGDDNESR